MASTADFKGKWALVTGASAGIGTALARELARYGANLVLTARRVERLEALATELRGQGVEVRVVKANLLDPNAPIAIFDAIEEQGIEIDILVNNAGLGQFAAFATCDVEQELSQVAVNCDAVVRLSRLFVPHMVRRGRGWVLIVSSTASFQPLPYMATYAATKAFDRLFALGLAEEVAPYGVKVTALCPGPTKSEFFAVSRATVFERRPPRPAEEVARLGLEALARGKRTVIPNFSGRMLAFIVRFVPTRIITHFVAKESLQHLPQS
ncbi:MAG: SDR family oxidoreductase [Terracidiphilus sp.]